MRRSLTALVLTLGVVLFSAGPVAAQNGFSRPLDERTAALDMVEVHLVYTDTDGKQQDYSLATAPADLVKKLSPRLQVESKLPLLDPKIKFFDGLWLANRDAVCKELVAVIQQTFPAGATNTAYDVSCRPFKFGFQSAMIMPNQADYFPQYNSMGVEVIPAGGYPTGKVDQLQIGYSVPLNIVPFTLTSSCTCHSANLLCNKDPDFTISYDVTFTVVANSTEANSLVFNATSPQMKVEYYVGTQALVMEGGQAFEKKVAGLEQTIETQLLEAVATLAATGDLSIVSVIAELFYDFFRYGPGSLFEATCDSNLNSAVTAFLGGGLSLAPPTVIKMANQADQTFKTLLLALQSGSLVGFTNLDVIQGADHSLEFKLSDLPAKPKLSNDITKADAATNPASKGIHLVTPTIGTGGQQVKPGVPFLVSGTNFASSSSNQLFVSWDRTLSVAGKSTLQWGEKGSAMQTVPLPLLNDYATPTFATPATLKPATAYDFRVQECDAIACSPWSDTLETSTQSTTTNNVKLWLDNDTARPIGTGAPGLGGAFEAQATIPAGTAPGTHTINAATTGNTPLASVQVTVAGASGSSATIAVMNSATRAAMPQPVNLLYPTTIQLRGDGFTPGEAVIVYLDSASGTPLGTATPAATGIFLGNFNIPMTSSGTHKLVAIQGTVQASEEVNLASQPK